MKKKMAQEEKNGNDDDKHDNESDDIDEIACGPVDEAGTLTRLMVIASHG